MTGASSSGKVNSREASYAARKHYHEMDDMSQVLTESNTTIEAQRPRTENNRELAYDNDIEDVEVGRKPKSSIIRTVSIEQQSFSQK